MQIFMFLVTLTNQPLFIYQTKLISITYRKYQIKLTPLDSANEMVLVYKTFTFQH